MTELERINFELAALREHIKRLQTKIMGFDDVTTTAFGEVSVAGNTAFIQVAPIYNLLPSNFRDFNSGTGTAGVENKMFKVSTGTGVGGYGAVQSFRALNYKPGQGGLARFTALFESNVTNSWQGVGLVNLSDELSFGYNGTTFGIWHRYGGYAESRTIQVTGAAGGSENLSLTLNGTLYTIPLTTGTVQHNAAEIADWLNANQSIWHADQLNDSVIIAASSDGAKAGTYTFSSTTATGTITQDVAGVTKTSDHIPQTSWNKNRASWLDPTKGNVYQITYQYLGFGNINFFVENPDTGEFVLVHIIKYTNANTGPSLTNPSLRVGLYAVSLGSTTDLVVRTASMAAFTQGDRDPTRNPRAERFTQSVTTTFTNVLSLRNRYTYNGYINQVEITPTNLSISNESSKNVVVQILANPTYSAEQNYQTVGNNLVVDKDTSNVTVSGGTLLGSYTVSGGGTLNLDLRKESYRIPPTLNICIAARVTSGAAANVTAALTWYEDL